MKLKKLVSAVTSAFMLTASVPSALGMGSYAADTKEINYGEALALSLYFYDANECGNEVDDGALSWRGNCHTYDSTASLDNASGLGSTEKELIRSVSGSTVDVSGGYHDAGDHVKFNLTMGFNATSLGWAYYDYPDVFKETGTEAHLLDIIRNTCDYFMKTTYLDSDNNVVAFCYNVSDSSDHNYWSSPETQNYSRKTYWATKSNNNSTVAFEMSSAFASASSAFKGIDDDYSAECLKFADALYRFGKDYNGNETAGMGDMYGTSNSADEKAWAEAWLYVADSDTYSLPTLKPNGRGYYGSEIDNWIYCWDKVWGGYSSLMYSLTGDSAYATEIKYEMDNLVSNKNQAYYPISGWGTSRYNCAWQKYAITYAEGKGDAEYLNYAKNQMDYILGNNPTGYSFLIGYGDKYPTRIHHRAANPGVGDPSANTESTYTLYGALIGGPTTANGDYEDNANRYQYTEPALDYNACFTLAISGLYAHFGGDASAVNDTIASASEFKSGYDFGEVQDNGETVTKPRPVITTSATTAPSAPTTTAPVVNMEDGKSSVNLNTSLNCKSDNQIHLTIGDYIPADAQLKKIIVNLDSSSNMGTVVSAAGFSTNSGWYQIDKNLYMGTSGTLEFDTSDVSTEIINSSEMMFGLWWCDSVTLNVSSITFEYQTPEGATTATTTTTAKPTTTTTTTTTTKPTTTTTTTTTTKPTTTTTTTTTTAKPTTTTTTTTTAKPTTTTTTTTTTKPTTTTTTTTTTKPTTTTTTTTTTAATTTAPETTTEPVDNEIVLTDVSYNSSYSLKDYDYKSIEQIIIKLDGSVGYGFGGKLVLGSWTVQMDYSASNLESDNTIVFDVTNPQDVLTLYNYWGNMSLESVTLVMKK
ncbi:MAG: glycoside hydrolase family 9 protein [Ruminococcus flavefaciens]|nr:glycoside hydrolase family 9 protein [Ruminococcus flavefaciens]MCM1229835.1 glycoside hydrolase family 9 protein [Ruminococcus flavefaciens]